MWNNFSIFAPVEYVLNYFNANPEVANELGADYQLNHSLQPEAFAQEVSSILDSAKETIIDATSKAAHAESQAQSSSLYDTIYNTGYGIASAISNTASFVSNTLQTFSSASATTANISNSSKAVTKSLDQLVMMVDVIGQSLLMTLMTIAPETIEKGINEAACEQYNQQDHCERYSLGTGIACLIASTYTLLTLKDLLMSLKRSKNQDEFDELLRQGQAAFKIQQDKSMLSRVFGRAQHMVLSGILFSMGLHYALPTAAVFGIGAIPLLAPVMVALKKKIFKGNDSEELSIAETTQALRDLQQIQAGYQFAQQQQKLFERLERNLDEHPELLNDALDRWDIQGGLSNTVGEANEILHSTGKIDPADDYVEVKKDKMKPSKEEQTDGNAVVKAKV